VDQVTFAMENIKQASLLNVESMRQVEISAQNLNEMGQRLKQMIGQYRV
jgi:methyl-accepting chemotaxis protein